MWPKKKKPRAPDTDMSEAQQMRAEAHVELHKIREQDAYVSSLAARLVERRELDAFGHDVKVTFTRRHA